MPDGCLSNSASAQYSAAICDESEEAFPSSIDNEFTEEINAIKKSLESKMLNSDDEAKDYGQTELKNRD